MGLEISGVGGVNSSGGSDTAKPYNQLFGMMLDSLETYKAGSPISDTLLSMLEFVPRSISKASSNYTDFQNIMSDITHTSSMSITASDLTKLKAICTFYSQASSEQFVFDPTPLSRIVHVLQFNDFGSDLKSLANLSDLNGVLGDLQILQIFSSFSSPQNHKLSIEAIDQLKLIIENFKHGTFDLNKLVEVKRLVDQL